jgi:carboxylate-amine ligase
MTELTLGIEEELHIVDMATGHLAARAPELLSRLPKAAFTAELQQTTVEINTSVCNSLDGMRAELLSRRRQLVQVAGESNLAVAAVGIVAVNDPMSLTQTTRFEQMREDYQLLVDEQMICGTQVHVGVSDRDLAVAVAQRLGPWLPILLALSASSPFWRGRDSGYASMRTLIWERWPTAGPFGQVGSAEEYDALVDNLVASGVIADSKMAYFDIRPSSHVPTLELRVCDACPLVDDAILIAGLFRALVAKEIRGVNAGQPAIQIPHPLHRAAMWRAARSGLEGSLIDVRGGGRPVRADHAVGALIDYVRPELVRLGDWDKVRSLAASALARGSSAARQRIEYARRGRLSDVVDLVVAETQGLALASSGHMPGQRRSLLAAYPSPPGDEVLGPDGIARFTYQGLLQVIEDGGPPMLRERGAHRDDVQRELGLTFGVEGEERLYPVDLIPRIVSAVEWQMLRAGLSQRARALEMFLRDAYGDQRAIRDGIVPAEAVTGSRGWRDTGRRVPAAAIRAHVMGVDLVRDERGRWIVLEDNLRVPSGIGYSLAIRALLDTVMPGLPRPRGLLRGADAPDLLRRALRASAPWTSDPHVVLLSTGPQDSAWFEHQELARLAGLTLALPADLMVDGDRLMVLRDGEKSPVDVIYLRLEADALPGYEGADGQPLGNRIWDLMEVGTLAVANAPGNGVGDDKALYAYVPRLIEYFLGEAPVLRSVRTYPCSNPDDREMVLSRLDDLVVKPVDGYGGGGVLIGPHATHDELEERRAEILADPDRWVGQEVISLSSHPTFDGRRLEPRHVDLRAFVYLSGDGPDDIQVADAALTRVAPAGSMVVNSSRGGGAKDTWLMGTESHDSTGGPASGGR